MAADQAMNAESVTSKASRGGDAAGLIVSILILTVIGGGVGAFLGLKLFSTSMSPVADSSKLEVTERSKISENTMIRSLAPIITNLADAKRTTIRLQTALVYDSDPSIETGAIGVKITEDILMAVRTWTLADLEGASGLQLLRQDLTDRARIRSDGRVREVVIQSLIVE